METFSYDPAVLLRFPHLVGGAFLADGLVNGPTPEALRLEFAGEQARIRQQIGSTPLSEIASLAGWRSAFRLFGVDPTQYRSAAEALLRRLTKKGDIPSINTVVDCCNLVSIRYALPVAAFDGGAVQEGLIVRFAQGSEYFTTLGEEIDAHPLPGEVIFTNPAGRVMARRWCWRQSEDSAARAETRRVLCTIEAQHPQAGPEVARALADLQELLKKYAGGSTRLLGLTTRTQEGK
jgi:DNA/RNA-binding domain of Phe-tRNA-synthetase-like protein